MADNKLLDEFKGLIETVSLEVIKEAQMKEVAKDVVTRSYKAEIADALEVISEEIERVKRELQALDYISDEEIKALVYGAYEKQSADIKDSEEHIKNLIAQSTQELYIASEKVRSEVATLNEEVERQLTTTNKLVENSICTLVEKQRVLKDSLESSHETFKSQIQKLFWLNYGLIGLVVVLLIFILTRGNYGG